MLLSAIVLRLMHWISTVLLVAVTVILWRRVSWWLSCYYLRQDYLLPSLTLLISENDLSEKLVIAWVGESETCLHCYIAAIEWSLGLCVPLIWTAFDGCYSTSANCRVSEVTHKGGIWAYHRIIIVVVICYSVWMISTRRWEWDVRRR